MSAWDDITACANEGCEHRSTCYRGRVYEEHKGAPEPSYLKSAYFSRDPSINRMRGWDCFWAERGAA